MSDDKLELSRRKILGSVGAVGAAGAAAGLGTSALFSDEESFTNNSITAGTLDLKIGWEEHYFDGKNRLDFSGSSDISASDVEYVDGSPASGRTTLPLDATSPQNGAAVSVPDQATALDLLDVTEVDDWPGNFDPSTASGDPCNYLADGSEQSPVIIDLDDVKPGDFGEITFSFALCDNPGYLWLQGCLQDSSENGVTEPEADSSDEDQQEGTSDEPPLKSGSGDGTVELLDEVQAAWWYDDGDNLQSGGGGGGSEPVCVQIVLDASGSMSGDKNTNTISGAKTLADQVLSANDDNRVGVTFFSADGYSEGAEVQQFVDTTDDADDDGDIDPKDLDTTEGVIDSLPADGGNTAVGAGIDKARDDLVNCDDNRLMVVLTNGGENVESQSDVVDRADQYCEKDDIEIATIAVGIGADTGFLENLACKPDQLDAPENAFTSTDPADIEDAFNDLAGEVLGGEELINAGNVQARGSLREILNELCPDTANDDYGLPIDGDRSTAYDEQNDPVDDSDREEFSAGTRHDIGFAWWVPRSVGNQIQSDSATFSLGFYAVQSRNNDGFGNA